MTVWCHLPTIFSRRLALRTAGLIMIFVAFITTLIFADLPVAAVNTNKVINFQGRLQTAAGAVVPDGYYNMQFKIYQGGAGAAVNNPGGSHVWTETYVNNGGNNGIRVKNGYFSVSLGSVNTFGSNVDWNHDTIWLSMNVAGSAPACASFGGESCGADGEMLPMKRITAVPYAINSGALNGKTADNFVQLGQGVQTDASSNTSSIFLNKIGSGNLIQLQSGAVDVFGVTNTGDLTLGSNADKTISIADSAADTAGRQLAITAGGGGVGSGSNGGDLVLQGGAAGGTDGNGGNIQIDAGAGSGTGSGGLIAIGSANASSITIGSTTEAISQDISIGANNTAGSTSNVTVGAGGEAASGSTTIQAKDDVIIASNGITRATFSGTTNTVYFGNGVASSLPSDTTIQGTDSSANAVAGGSLTVQGGNATTGNANGGNVILAGGAGSGNGASGLVIMNTPTFSTSANDANCYTGGNTVASSCTITNASVDNSAAIIVGFSNPGQTATLPDPTNTTAGRIMYIMAAGDSQNFTLSSNGGGTGNEIALRQNTAVTMIWNGTDWITAGGSGLTTIQDAYDNTAQGGNNTELTVNNGNGSDGLTIRDGGANASNNALLEVQRSDNSSVFSVNNTVTDGTEHAADGTVSDGENFDTNWTAVGSAQAERVTSDGQAGSDSAKATAGTAAGNGIRNKLGLNPRANTRYTVSFYAKLLSGSAFTDLTVRYSPDGGSSFVDCSDYSGQTATTATWTLITCFIDTPATAVTDPYVYFIQPDSAENAREYLIDTFSFTVAPSNIPNVKVGGNGESTTLLTVDKGDSAPAAEGNHEAMLGSMYYDTTKGKLQCYEAEGWGDCGASPDNFVTLSPEYANAVRHGDGVGDMSTGLCSDELNINDGSSDQPEICSSNETYNYYHWKSQEITTQLRSIFVTYQLPGNFKEFIPGSTSLMGRTDSADASVTYHIYRNTNTGLTACGSATTASTGPQTSWQKVAASGGADPSACDFAAGDSIVIRIDLNAANDANAYASNLGFTFSTH